MDAEFRSEIGRALGTDVVRATAVRGGDINEAWRIETEDGRRVFVKTNASADARMFPSEARGLEWLAEGPLRVPRVLGSNGDDARAGACFLALEWIDRGAPARGADETLGRGLARLHRLGAPSFGLGLDTLQECSLASVPDGSVRSARTEGAGAGRAELDNFLGTIAQDNTAARDWPTFYGERRLEPLLRRAIARGASTTRMERGVERVIASLPTLCGPPEPPSRLHGDLWGGNLMHDEHGAPVLIDPAAYGGHREIDLAMMQLFGGFSRAVFDAYADEHPLAAGHEDRVPLYQLLPLLAHAVLFGASWTTAIEAALDRIGV